MQRLRLDLPIKVDESVKRQDTVYSSDRRFVEWADKNQKDSNAPLNMLETKQSFGTKSILKKSLDLTSY